MKTSISATVDNEVVTNFRSLKLNMSAFIEEQMIRKFADMTGAIEEKPVEKLECRLCKKDLSHEKIIKLGKKLLCRACFLVESNEKLLDIMRESR